MSAKWAFAILGDQPQPARSGGHGDWEARAACAPPFLLSSLRLHLRSCEPAGAERGLKIETANRTVEVEHFAGKVQSWPELALHGPRIDFVERYPTRGDFGFPEAQGPTDVNLGSFDHLAELAQLRIGSFSSRLVHANRRSPESRVRQAVGEQMADDTE